MEQNFRASSDRLPWREYFAEYAEWRAGAFGEAETEVIPTEILESGPVDPQTVTAASPKKYIRLALEHGLTVKCHKSVTLERGTLFKGGDRAGERRPDKTKVHLWTFAYIPKKLAFRAYHVDNRFTDAVVWDVAGWPTVLEADYSYNKNEQKTRQMSEDRARAIELRLVNQYNDQEQWINKAPRVVASVTAFEEWLHDLFPTFTPKTPAIRKPKEADEEVLVKEILAGEEWSAA